MNLGEKSFPQILIYMENTNDFLIKIAKFRPLEIILADVLESWNFVTWDNFRCTLRIWCPFYSMINR